MIETVTLNPSLDLMVWTKDMKLGEVNRVEHEEFYPGGKGLNVSILLSRLGIENRATGFAAGFTGEELLRCLEQEQCSQEFIVLPEGRSRINVKLIPVNGDNANGVAAGERAIETDFNAPGPKVPEWALEELYRKLDGLKGGDWLVLAGSVPEGLPKDIYVKILNQMAKTGCHAVVDTSGTALRKVLACQPFLIKPNRHELEDIFQTKLDTEEALVEHARRLQAEGAKNVLVSLGKWGAILVLADGRVFKRRSPQGKAIQAVGAGDSMVAGFLTGYLRTGDPELALELGVAAGSATAFSKWLAGKDQIRALLEDPQKFGL